MKSTNNISQFFLQTRVKHKDQSSNLLIMVNLEYIALPGCMPKNVTASAFDASFRSTIIWQFDTGQLAKSEFVKMYFPLAVFQCKIMIGFSSSCFEV